jgi:putative PEP-CTERM system histidine kinase
MSPPVIEGGACVAAFAVLAGFALRSRAGRVGLAVAAGAIAFWAGLAAWRGASGAATPAGWQAIAAAVLETARSAALLALLMAMFGRADGQRRARSIGLGAAMLALVLLDLWAMTPLGSGAPRLAAIGLAGHLMLALVGLIVVENVWRNADTDGLWATKFLLIALGALFAYDFYLFADAMLFRQVDSRLAAARPLVTAIAAPLIALSLARRSVLSSGLTLSRRAAFHTAALVGGGLYLVAMGAAGILVRSLGGEWGPVFQIGFMAAAGMLLAAILASGSVRAALKGVVARHFFAYRYDYREEWLRFIATIAEDRDDPNLRSRVIKAIAAVVESPGGVMWLLDEASASYGPAGRWNFREFVAREPATGELAAALLAGGGATLDLDASGRLAPPRAGLRCPAWLAEAPDAWVIVPLMHRGPLLGFVLLQKSRAPRALSWEDEDLLRTIGRQAAAFIAEQQASQALADARQLDLFQRRFAFVAHDLKTVIGQLSLMLANAERHGDDPTFQADVMATVRDSVGAMQQLLAQLRGERRREGPTETVDLVPLARRLIGERGTSLPPVVLECAVERLEVQGDARRVGAVLGHLLHNACEAALTRVVVRLHLGPPEIGVVLEVEDDGPGMSTDFIQDQLFRPFASTKEGGYGIGAYQCRELTRELHGQLTVWSTPGKGTRMRVTLPAADLRLAAIRPARAVS